MPKKVRSKKLRPAPKVVRETATVERVRKNMDIDVLILARARRALGASSDTETVNRALAEVARADEIVNAFDALREAGGLDDVFGHLAN